MHLRLALHETKIEVAPSCDDRNQTFQVSFSKFIQSPQVLLKVWKPMSAGTQSHLGKTQMYHDYHVSGRQQAASSHSRPFIAIHGQLSGRGAPKKFKVVVLGDEAAGAILWHFFQSSFGASAIPELTCFWLRQNIVGAPLHVRHL